MRTIYLLRHAKSDWGDPGLVDYERPLSARGRDAAPRVAAYMRVHHYQPDLVLCSTARRTRETLELVRGVLGDEVRIEFEDQLYLAEHRRLMERLRAVESSVGAVMFVGHNPGIEQFAHDLSAAPKGQAQEEVHRRMRAKFSTCALAVIRTSAKSWHEAKARFGTLKDFVRPADI